MDLEKLKYPIGQYSLKKTLTERERKDCLEKIRTTPQLLREAIQGLSEAQLNTPYRPDGWTVRQVVHHVPDSHINSYVRFRWAMTEPSPTIKAYEEQHWAELPDGKNAPINISLDLLEVLHKRWMLLLDSMTETDFAKILVHPVSGELTLDEMLQIYAWHGPHHIAHITELRKREGWT